MAEFVDGISDEEVIKRLKEYVKNQLGSENRYKITDCHFHMTELGARYCTNGNLKKTV